MRKILFLFSIFCCVILFGQKKFQKDNQYHFYENKGQIVDQNGEENKDVKYLFHSAGLNVQLRSNGFSYDVYETKKTTNPNFNKNRENLAVNKRDFNTEEYIYENLFHRIDIDLINSNRDSKIIAEGKSADYENYYNLSYKPDGVTNVHRYQKIVYKNIYNNIDLIFFKPKDSLKPIEYNFIINPGGKVSDIKMKFNGAPTSIENDKLLMKVRFGDMYENIPNSWIGDQNKKEINVLFKDFGNQIYGFNSPVDSSDKKIVIDPVPTRIWGSYVAGFGDEYIRAKTDSQSTLYIFGGTTSTTNFATSGTYQQNVVGGYDAVIMKVTKFGQKIWGTYYGFNQNDFFNDVDFDENFNIYAGGKIQRMSVNDNMVVTKFNSNGAFIFQKEFLTNSNDTFFSISYNQNHVYFAGDTFSFDFPTVNAMQPAKASPSGFTDGIIGSLDATTANVDWLTYFGKADGSTSMFQIFSSVNDLEIIGATQSSTLPMVNAFQPLKAGITDGVYLRLSKSGNNIIRSSYYGNAGQDVIRKAIIVNNILILPGEYSTPAFPLGQAGVWRVNLSNNTIIKNYFNLQDDYQLLAYPDTFGNVFFTGLHSNGQPDVSTPGAYLGMPAMYISTFLVKYNQNDLKEWGTYYTGNGATQLGEVTKDSEDAIYLTGMSSGNTSGIATPGTFQQQGGGSGNNDAFIAKFRDCSSTGMVNSNSPVCINSNIQLTATGGTTYAWTGPNGFTSTLQNPTISNAIAANAGTYTCQITGSGACDGSFTVNVVVGDNTPPVPTLASLSDVTGNCNTTISIFPTATDNCAGTITATTTDPLSYSTPGTHVIHWTYNDGNGNISTQNQNVIISATPLPTTANATQTFCATYQPKMSDLQITGQNIKWYDTTNSILPITTPFVNGQTYFASQTINGCESAKISIQVIVNNTTKPTAAAIQDFCASANPKLSNLVVNGTALIYYDSAGNILPLTTPLVHGQTYFVTQTINNCESEKLGILVTLSQNNVPANNYRETFCNVTTGNTMVVNLTIYQSNIIANPNNYIFTYTNQLGNPIANPSNYTLNIGTNIINVKVATADGCFINVILELHLNPKPVITLPEDFDFCRGKIVTLDAGAGFVSYLWSTGATTQTITVSTPGTYWVKVTNSFGCENTDSIQLTYSVLGEIVSVNISNNSATVIMSTPGNYEYSLDNQNWQNSNVFSNLTLGEYKVYVRTKSGCIIGEKNFSIFNIPNMITPNGDGTNDKWRIAGLENYSGTEILVYDRKGLIVFKQTITKKPFEWDGKYNSNPLATGNYWYTIKVSDGRVYNGWLLIKNRN
ncbi:T9SS type B sorting domain-containing protein [Chryseobacterium sp. PBS4-4]|uniref:T9SS type B sorting domain-containing protein n=1 Tax=Chryseobacterium edaphi TaxID=2976532 RepID=A0ABT2W3J9_9FLAO|nr:T9SS type B sorting domain-containing protein [Chryseobacterium edaphi]MCU7616801.1 T9SS type B sorting domain-containing protein [Chryseobacterium edaphi]